MQYKTIGFLFLVICGLVLPCVSAPSNRGVIGPLDITWTTTTTFTNMTTFTNGSTSAIVVVETLTRANLTRSQSDSGTGAENIGTPLTGTLNETTQTSPSSSVLSIESLFAGSGSILAALITFILIQTLGKYLSRRSLKRTSLAALIAELEVNRKYEVKHAFIKLEDYAFRLFRRNGFLNDLQPDLRNDIIELYSQIRFKNDLIPFYRIFPPPDPGMRRSWNFEVLEKYVTDAEVAIISLIDSILPKL